MDELDEVVGEFLVESFENLDRMDDDLLALERAPGDVDAVASIFRAIHTIKGTCAFLGFSHLERVTHVGENLLGKLRDGELRVTGEITTALLATTDAVRTMLSAIEATGADGEADFAELVDVLTALHDGEVTPAPAAPARVAAPTSPPASSTSAALAPQGVPAAEEVEVPRLGEMLVAQGVPREVIDAAAAQQLLDGDPRPLGEILVARGDVSPALIEETLARQHASRIAATSVRVDVGLLDGLMSLVGELVLARNQVVQLGTTIDDPAFTAVSRRLDHITSALQEGVMKTRMQPIGNVWGKFPRVVRDLALYCGKQVRVEMEGQDTELDKTIIEAIKDPLTHLVRNAVDHGVETPRVRAAAGKPAEGLLSLRAFHEDGTVNVEIADDGAGIDVSRLVADAVGRGLVTAEAGQDLDERESLRLVFAPGVTTAARVTNVSGRGVGMDVVRTNVERIGGTVDLTTERGRGTTFRIRIPLTHTIVPALVVSAGGERFAVPQISLVELVRLDAGVEPIVEHPHGAPLLRLRDRLLPLLRLSAQLGLGMSTEEPAASVVVLQAEGQQFGLLVDAVHDVQEIVVRPLDRQLEAVGVYAGATIVGDGRAALLLDVAGLGRRGRVVGAHHLEELTTSAIEPSAKPSLSTHR